MHPFFSSLLDRLRTLFDPSLIGSEVATLLGDTLVSGLIFAAFYLLWRLAAPLLRHVIARTRVDETTESFLETVLKFLILTVGAIVALTQEGVEMPFETVQLAPHEVTARRPAS